MSKILIGALAFYGNKFLDRTSGLLLVCLHYREKGTDLYWVCVFSFLRQNSGISSHFVGIAKVIDSLQLQDMY